MDSLLSFPVCLFHPLQHAGLSRCSPSAPSMDGLSGPGTSLFCCGMPFYSATKTTVSEDPESEEKWFD